MKILFVIGQFPCLSETFVLNQVTGLLDLGHDVTVCAIANRKAQANAPYVQQYGLGNRIWCGETIPCGKLKRIATAVSKLPAFLRRCGLHGLQAFNPLKYKLPAANLTLFYSCLPLLNRDTRFDAIQCHFGNYGLRALAWRNMGLVRGPILTVFHAHELAGLSDQKGRRLYFPLFKCNTLLLPISERWRQRLIRWGARPERTIVHHMGVDLGRFEYAPRFPGPDETVQILSVGRLVEQKGFEYAIRAVSHLRQLTSRGLQYTIIGSGELENPLKGLVSELGISDIVTFAGPLLQDQVRRRMHESHIFLLPSVTAANGFQEGIPVAIMEAMASGLPVVTSRHSGIPELVEHDVSGFLAKEREVVPLAESMERLMSDSILCRRISAAGREKVEREFDIRKLNMRLQEILSLESDRYLAGIHP